MGKLFRTMVRPTRGYCLSCAHASRRFGVATFTLTRPKKSGELVKPKSVQVLNKIKNPLSSVPPWRTGSRTKIIQQLNERRRKGGECYHLISKKWWDIWKLHDGGLPAASETKPIDNSDLLNEYNRLRKGLRLNEDYMYIPPEAWYLLVAW